MRILKLEDYQKHNQISKEQQGKLTTELLVSLSSINKAHAVYMMSMKKILHANSDSKSQSRNQRHSNRLAFKTLYLNRSREWHLINIFNFLNLHHSKQLFNRNQSLSMLNLVTWPSMSRRKFHSLVRDPMKIRKLLAVASVLSALKCIVNALLLVKFAENHANVTDVTMTKSISKRDSMLNSK